MSATWHSDALPEPERFGMFGVIRAIARGSLLAVITFGCLAVLLLVRLIEKPVFGLERPITPYITQFVCRSAFVILGLPVRVTGVPMDQKGAYVANHSSWLDIFVLNAQKRIYFVSKAEVAKWPGIGWLARATGTVFITRRTTDARKHQDQFAERLDAGHQLLFFPEGTSTDGRQVLPFKSTLFQPFFNHNSKAELFIQPVSVTYHAPNGFDARFYGWWGDMGFGEHLYKTLAAPRQGLVELVYHAPRRISDGIDRKQLAAQLQADVRAGLNTRD